MKICVLTHTFPRSSQDTTAAFMKEFCDGLVFAGGDVLVVTPFDTRFKRSNDLFRIYTYKYIWPLGLHTLGYSRAMESDIQLKPANYLLIPLMILFGTIKLLNVVKKEKIDIVNVHWILPNGLIALLVSKFTGVPYVVTLPGTDVYLAFKNKVFGFVAKIIANESSGVFSNSRLNLNRILDLGVGNKLSDVIAYPTNVKEFKPSAEGLGALRKKHGLSQDNLVILSVGRLVYKKGFEYLVRAMIKVAKLHPKAKLLIGGDGDLKEELLRLIVRNHLENNVFLIGTIKRDEIKNYYNLADIMVTPSVVDKKGNVDGGPVSVAESMASGKPQILTNILGMATYIKNGENGFVIEEKDVSALENAIIKLIKSPDLRKKMGTASRKVAEVSLSNKKIGSTYLNYFRMVVNK